MACTPATMITYAGPCPHRGSANPGAVAFPPELSRAGLDCIEDVGAIDGRSALILDAGREGSRPPRQLKRVGLLRRAAR